MAYSGKYTIQNKQKYRGDPSKVQYRSSWELSLMKYLDICPIVKEWGSETAVIPYFSEADQKKRRYFMDFYVKYEDGSVHLWEVKPLKETCQPKPPNRMTAKSKERFMHEIYTWQTNLCKWKAAKTLCDKKGWTFKIITEKTLRSHFGIKV